MIEPFEDKLVSGGVISFGVSSYGYDMRISNKFLVPVIEPGAIIDPKDKENMEFREIETDRFLLEPGTYALARSLEYFRIPRDVLALCSGKSTYARCGVLVNLTPFEPEWEGYVTIAISNTAPSPVLLRAGEGIAQVIFIAAENVCAVSYSDRKGKYQGQKDITTAKICE